MINRGTLDVSASQEDQDGGDISITAQRFAQLGRLQANGLGEGNGGNMAITIDQELYIGEASTSNANAGHSGDGGRIIYFADGDSYFSKGASISATGGNEGGDGGFVEVSGLRSVRIDGSVDTRAALGKTGTFLIDPTNITVVASTLDANGAFSVAPGDKNWVPDGSGSSEIISSSITGLLAANNAIIDTATVDTGADTGLLTVNEAIDLDGASGTTLTLRANNLMTINANICDGGATCLIPDSSANLVFDTSTHNTSGSIVVGTAINIISGGGSIDFLSDFGLTIGTAAEINSGGGAMTISTVDAILLGDTTALNSGGGNIIISAVFGSVSANNGGSSDAIFNAGGGNLNISSSNSVSNAIDLHQSSFSNINVTTHPLAINFPR